MCDLSSVSSVVFQKKQFIHMYFLATAFLIFCCSATSCLLDHSVYSYKVDHWRCSTSWSQCFLGCFCQQWVGMCFLEPENSVD